MAPRRTASDRGIVIWLLICAAMIFGMVVLGGITRLTQSGLSITEWQPVTGVLPPLSEAGWEAEFAKYREIPQFKLMHSWMTLADFKGIFFWEWLHRLWGRLIGLAFFLPFLWFLVQGRVSAALRPRLIGILVLGGLQGLLGWVMVESGLNERVEVSQYRLVAHLGLAAIIYAAILWTAFGLIWRRPDPANPRTAAARSGLAKRRHAASLVLALVFATMLAGGFVAGLNAGLTYNTFPLMDGRFVPAGYGQLDPWWRNLFENVAAVQFDHRILAMTSFTAILIFWFASRRARLGSRARRAIDLLLGIACLQVALGITTLLLAVPVALGVLHQAGAILLFTAALLVRHSLRPAQPGSASEALLPGG